MKPLLASLLVLFPLVAPAADFVAPGAGSLLQQLQPVKPPAPSPIGPELNIEQKGGGKLPTSVPFPVKSIQISGNEKIDTQTLHALVADAEGTSITLHQLSELADRITGYYHGHGYPLARAFIPAQTIQSGMVRIEVMEARYGEIKLHNDSKVIDSLLQDTLSPLQVGQTIGQAGLDRALLLLSDIPGVAANATLKTGESVGTSDLLVNASPGPAVIGNLVVDGYGNRYTGRPRVGGTVNWINPLHHGDVLSLSGLSSGDGLNYGRLAYESLVNGQGTRLGGSYSALHYELGGSLSALNAHGSAQVGSVWGNHPLIRSRNFNLYGQLEYDRRELRDRIDVGDIRSFRHIDNGTLSVSGDARDRLLSGGINTWSLGWTVGHVGFDNQDAQLLDAATVKTQGMFSKWNANLARLQNLTERDELYLAFAGQWAQDNLDSSMKMIVGGPYTVRGYDMGAVSGDTGYIGTAELRHGLGSGRFGQFQVVGFIDSAQVTVNQNPWSAGTNRATLSGAGGGINWLGPKLNWAGAGRLSARTYIATPVGPVPDLVGKTDSVRAWMEIGMGF
ncbi:ShlB/FhaC/HecB family hemolysin secretion/activation protein [Methylobacter sp.]|uniref:ShlB/FhaC/HecB family hemolysin secretion/activation protein n=1 Tax=Methylobacter sp. TaxID=2051955 RepID=UPI0012118B73|nr:ShlB/FhaC/HecB family hemolysin secretion/activation protein [Methylobacter sp.]TAK64174.1 MAG: ShlB/FhaC/HecB family hemolysin secretion/activation protein [Methylobacter sp.]